ncbi:hypothetical protein JRQ81_010895 [Phrynocephalus forsythii]|uniref:Uncharacterized protein n=1 Tax=Phrynocephalus forsythii TaxID=171643 RepID=A0A9Q0Y2G6_9SAUR|nr:hypothetical protein JRQ81_010895 [Phrynocephalus forsythii]
MVQSPLLLANISLQNKLMPILNNPHKELPGEEKPLQENTISSSQKLEEASGDKASRKKTRNGNGVMQKQKSKHQEGKAESALSEEKKGSCTGGLEAAMDFAECNDHRVSYPRAEPVIKKTRLGPEQRVRVTGDENKLVLRRKGKKAPPSLETDGVVAEERKEKKKANLEANWERKGREVQEEILGCHSQAGTVVEEDSEGVKDWKNKKTQKKERTTQGEEGDPLESKRSGRKRE